MFFFFRLKLETKLAGIIKSYTQLHHAVYKRGKDCIIHFEIPKQLYYITYYGYLVKSPVINSGVKNTPATGNSCHIQTHTPLNK